MRTSLSLRGAGEAARDFLGRPTLVTAKATKQASEAMGFGFSRGADSRGTDSISASRGASASRLLGFRSLSCTQCCRLGSAPWLQVAADKARDTEGAWSHQREEPWHADACGSESLLSDVLRLGSKHEQHYSSAECRCFHQHPSALVRVLTSSWFPSCR